MWRRGHWTKLAVTQRHMLVLNLFTLGVFTNIIHNFFFPTIIGIIKTNHLSIVHLMNKASKAMPAIVCFQRLFDLEKVSMREKKCFIKQSRLDYTIPSHTFIVWSTWFLFIICILSFWKQKQHASFVKHHVPGRSRS